MTDHPAIAKGTVDAAASKPGWLEGVRATIAERRKTRLSGIERTRLTALVLSAKAAALAARMETLAEYRDTPLYDADVFGRTDREIRLIASRLAQLSEEKEKDQQSLNVAFAVMENSIGRALHLKGDFNAAIHSFKLAIHRLPTMPDPYVGIAAALLQLRETAGIDWRDQVSAWLNRATELNPRNGKAHYYRARLAIEDGQYEQALQELDMADAHHWMLYYKAVLLGHYIKPVQSRRALELLESSISKLPRPDERYAAFGRIAIEAEKGEVTVRQWQLALTFAEALANDAPSDDLKAEGATLSTKLQQRIRGSS